MRFLSRGWADGDIPDAQCEDIVKAYRKHMKEIRPQLPPAARELSKEVNLHDGIIEMVETHEAKGLLKLSIVCRDLHDRYQSADLQYSGVQIGDAQTEILKDRSRDRESRVLYDELDVEKGDLYVHRLMFHPVGEISIWFRDLTLTRSARDDLRVNLGPYYLELEDDDEDE